MPYIAQKLREALDGPIEELSAVLVARAGFGGTGGDFNYIFSALIANQVEYEDCSYALLNELIGALECCKLEVYRRLAAPHEDKAIEKNGDVFNG